MYGIAPKYNMQVRDVQQVLLTLRMRHGISEPTFEDCACHSPIENIWLFAARCRSVMKNGPPEQFD
jgi:hypothetical protein